MLRPFASIWRKVPADVALIIDRSLARACDQRRAAGPSFLFFRVDDVAVPGRQLVRLMNLFSKFRVPLCLAVVPAWLTPSRWRQLKSFGADAPELWCWHQHGWRHANHEKKKAKKQEFGPGRPASQIKNDIVRGRRRLESLMGNDFYPVFTPPWNRCSLDTLIQLKELNYQGVSRSKDSRPPPPVGLPDFQVNVDLHTRKDPDCASGWRRLPADLENAVSGGICGIMLHHRLMNAPAFEFLEVFLKSIVNQKEVFPTDFRMLSANKMNDPK